MSFPDTGGSIPSTGELLLRWDWERPRSQQRALGFSDLGSCRRRAGYQLHGYPPEKPSGSVQAVMGTAIHSAVTSALLAMRDEGLIPPDSVIDEEVHFAGLTGHPDLYVRPRVRDVKTLGFGVQLENYKLNGPPQRHLWQVSTYAAALIVQGFPVEEVQLEYLDRGSGKSWLYTSPFDPQHVKDAMAWLAMIRETELDMLSRDFAPDSAQCRHCPFSGICWEGHVINRDERSVILAEGGDAALWAERLSAARERKREAEADEAEAKGVLDGLRPNDRGSADVKIPGFPWLLRFTVSTSSRLDTDEVRADYARAGAVAPVRGGTSVKLTLVAPRDDDAS